MKKEKKLIKIILPKQRGNRNPDLFVSVNGENYLIQRGVEVEVPDYIAEVIRNSDRMAERADAFIFENSN